MLDSSFKVGLQPEGASQGSTLEKKPWGQLAPKFLDLVASANFLVAKNFRPCGPKTFT